jgi:hypothetical protein
MDRGLADIPIMLPSSPEPEREVFLTRQSEGFSLTEDCLDVQKSSYNNGVRDYSEKIATLMKAAGESSFIWGVPPDRRLRKYEIDRLVEWEVQVQFERIIGFVDVNLWADYLYDRLVTFPAKCFAKSRPTQGTHDVLLPLPLRDDEVFLQRIYKRHTLEKAEILSQVPLLQGARTVLQQHDVFPRPTTAERIALREQQRSLQRRSLPASP